MKKTIALVLAIVLAVALVGCGTSAKTETSPAASTDATASAAAPKIMVLTPTESTGWTGSVATFAKTTVEQINAEGKYQAEVKTASSGDEQNSQLEDIAANYKAGEVVVVILPFDDTVQSGLQAIIDKGIEYAAFDRLITSVASSAVANVKGDNQGVGAACGAYLAQQGLNPGDKVLVFEGDTSSVTTDRKTGLEAYLKGELEYDGKKIEKTWTDEDIKALTYSGSLSWSQANAQTWFETLMSDASNASVKYLCAFDDSFIIGVMDALKGSAVSDDVKNTFLSGKPFMTGCGGAENVYAILRGESDYTDIASQFGGICSTTYSPSMIQTTIQLMIDHLDGKTVEQDCVIKTEIVDNSNVKNYVGFN